MTINDFFEICEIMKFMIKKKKNKKRILINFSNLEIDIIIMKIYLFLDKHKYILFMIFDLL